MSCYNYTAQDVSNFFFNVSTYGNTFSMNSLPYYTTYTHLYADSSAKLTRYNIAINGPDSDYQRTDSNGDTCSTLAPYINSTFASPYSYYGTSLLGFNFTTHHPKGLISYNVTLLNTDDSAFTDTWIVLDYTNFDSEHKVLIALDFNKLGLYYDLATTSLTVRFKTAMEDGLAYSTEDVTFLITNEPILTTNVTNQTVRVGKVGTVTLDTRINPDRVIADYQIECKYTNETDAAF